MPFVKLDSQMLTSTLWCDRPAREVFITALLMAEPHELLESAPQIEVGSMNETGFVVPPGWYGFVRAAGPGIVRYCGLDQAEGMAALARLGSPDPDSRTKTFEGRRLVRIDHGFIILNYITYRDRDYTSAERSKRWREREAKKRGNAAGITRDATHRPDTATHRDITQAEGDVQKEKESPAGVPLRPSGPNSEAKRPAVQRASAAKQDGLPSARDQQEGRGTTHLQRLVAALDQSPYRANSRKRHDDLIEAAARLDAAGITDADLLKLAVRAARKGKKPHGLFATWVDNPDEALKELGKR